MGISLKDLLAALEEEGVVGDEAEEAVERFLDMRKRERGGALAKRERGSVQLSNTPVDQAPMVEYGDETPQEAEERWIEQEMSDPDGVFGGGASAGGIFGNAPVATRGYDPAARRRTLDMASTQAGVIERRVTVQVLTKIAERLGVDVSDIEGVLPAAGPAKQLPGRGRRRR